MRGVALNLGIRRKEMPNKDNLQRLVVVCCEIYCGEQLDAESLCDRVVYGLARKNRLSWCLTMFGENKNGIR